MAKKRLNKKVALIGSVVFVFLVLAAIWVILYLSRDPEKFIRDGDAALLAKDYERAERCYGKARSLAKTDSLRKEILFKAVDVYLETDRWRNVLGCWNEIISIDPKNVKARFGRLKYFYIMADSGVVQVWREVESQASEFMELVEEAGLLMEETAEWDLFQAQEAKVGRERIGPYLYLLRGRATLEMTRLGGITDPDESIERAINDLEKVRKLEPNSTHQSSVNEAYACSEKRRRTVTGENSNFRARMLVACAKVSLQCAGSFGISWILWSVRSEES